MRCILTLIFAITMLSCTSKRVDPNSFVPEDAEVVVRIDDFGESYPQESGKDLYDINDYTDPVFDQTFCHGASQLNNEVVTKRKAV